MVQPLWSNHYGPTIIDHGLTIIPLSWHDCLAIIHSPLLRSRFRIPLRTSVVDLWEEFVNSLPVVQALLCEACNHSRTAKITKLSLTLTLDYHNQLEIQTVPLLVLFSCMQLCVCSSLLTCIGHSCCHNTIIQTR